MSTASRFLWASILLTISVFPAVSDVLFLESGEIVLGTLISARDGNVVIRSLGSERTIEADQIDRSEEEIAALKDLNLEILLKDGTVIRGTVVDYDEEIGVFVDISFGNLALPLATIEIIQDSSRPRKKKTDNRVLGLYGQWTFTPSESFGGSAAVSASADFGMGAALGLYVGADIFCHPLNYTAEDQVRYTLAGLNVHGLYKAFWLADLWTVFKVLVPYAKLGGGAAFVQVDDDRAEAVVDSQGSLTGMVAGQLGLEWNLPSIFWLRFFFNADLVFQSSGVFFLPGAGVGLHMSL